MRNTDTPLPTTSQDTPQGLLFAGGAYVFWGFLPLYMKLLSHIPVAEVIARLTANRFEKATTPPAPLYLRAADAAPARDAPPQIIP